MRQILVVVVVGEIGDATEAVFFGGDAGEDTIICRRLCPRSPPAGTTKTNIYAFCKCGLAGTCVARDANNERLRLRFVTGGHGGVVVVGFVFCCWYDTYYHVGTLLGSAETKLNTNHKKTP